MKWNLTVEMAERICNTLELLGTLLVLFLAFAMQVLFHELPCPLCLLQRVGFFCIAFGFLLNLRFGFHPSHYAIIILSALFTSFTALRQVALHVVPGTGWYGDAIFGLHLYTWSYIISMIIIFVTTLMFSVDRQYYYQRTAPLRFIRITHALFGTLSALLILNIILVFLQCGISTCPENPTKYLF